MTETINSEWRTARKKHECNLCCCDIQPGEKYNYDLMKYDGELYDWKEHEKCYFIAGELWDYIEPDEGMTEEDFKEGCREFCRCFVCPDCEKYNEDEYCDEVYCLDKIYELLKEYELYKAWRDYNYIGWRLKKKEKKWNECQLS